VEALIGMVLLHHEQLALGSYIESDRFKSTARELDAALSLYYYRARWYDPQAGRFLREGPLSFTAGDTNVYKASMCSISHLCRPHGIAVVG
jgi:RHS repeat-associated protein